MMCELTNSYSIDPECTPTQTILYQYLFYIRTHARLYTLTSPDINFLGPHNW